MPDDPLTPDYDVVVIGGGFAGLAAALMLGRVRRRTLVCASGPGRNATVEEAHGYFTRDGLAPSETLRIGREQLDPYPDVQVREVSVLDAQQREDGFVVTLPDDERVSARRLLLATGLVDDLPALDGLTEVWGRTAFHCPYCDGWETQGKTVAVLAEGAGAVGLALQLVRYTPELVVCSNGVDTFDEAGLGLLRQHGIDIHTEPVARLDRDGDRLNGVVFASGETLERDLLFVAAAKRQHSDLAARLGCAVLDDGSVEVNDFAQTTVPGVYAAGDMARKAAFPITLGQIVFAAANGQLAAGAIDQELLLVDMPAYPSPLRALLTAE